MRMQTAEPVERRSDSKG